MSTTNVQESRHDRDEKTKDEAWLDVYGEGWKRLRKLRAAKDENRDFQFDILMANPPFAGDIKETRILAKYDLARTVSFDNANLAAANPPAAAV